MVLSDNSCCLWWRNELWDGEGFKATKGAGPWDRLPAKHEEAADA